MCQSRSDRLDESAWVCESASGLLESDLGLRLEQKCWAGMSVLSMLKTQNVGLGVSDTQQVECRYLSKDTSSWRLEAAETAAAEIWCPVVHDLIQRCLDEVEHLAVVPLDRRSTNYGSG